MWRTPLDEKETKRWKAEIHIIKDWCKGCGFCIEFCPRNVLEKSEEINKLGAHPPKVVDESRCVLCCFCSSICPDFAIFVTERHSEDEC
ncbi:4Fe-4S binding protein [Candidatus Bathyarchaeota archaeon]|nr:4Fe-4S binding protein [Candidatus Bathyarchaeota archaeon]